MNQEKIIKKTLDKIRKKTNFHYQKAIQRNKSNPTTHAKHKEIQLNRKNLSNDRFMKYLRDISKESQKND